MKWPTSRLEDCTRIVGGATPSTSVPDYWDGDVWWATPKDLSGLDGIYLDATPRTIAKAGLADCAAEILPIGSVLFSSRAPIGHVAINRVPVATNQGFKSFIPKKGVLDGHYLLWWLKTNRAYLESSGNGATFKELSKGTIGRVQVPLPPLAEQKRIAAILGRTDELRRKRRESFVTLDNLPQAIFSEMFGGKGGGSALAQRERLGDYLSFLTSGGRGWAGFYTSSGQRFIRSLDVQMNTIGGENAVFVTPPDNAEARRTKVAAGDVLLTITGSLIGRVSAVPDELAGSYISQHVAILRPKSAILPQFLSFYISLDDGGQKQIAKVQYGQTKPGLNFEQIRDFKVPIPPMALQSRFVARMRDIATLAARQRAHLAKLDSLFASLQHRAFNGELTSKHADRELEMVG